MLAVWAEYGFADLVVGVSRFAVDHEKRFVMLLRLEGKPRTVWTEPNVLDLLIVSAVTLAVDHHRPTFVSLVSPGDAAPVGTHVVVGIAGRAHIAEELLLHLRPRGSLLLGWRPQGGAPNLQENQYAHETQHTSSKHDSLLNRPCDCPDRGRPEILHHGLVILMQAGLWGGGWRNRTRSVAGGRG